MGIRVRIHPTNAATVAGVNYSDLREIVTAAELNCYESIAKAKKRKTKGNAETIAYHEGLLKAAQALRLAIEAGINTVNGHPNGYSKDHLLPSEMTVAERRARLAEEKREREMFDAIFAAMVPKAAAV